MISRSRFYLVVACLFLAGLGLTVHRHVQYEVPLVPGEEREVWQVEAQVRLEAQGGPVQVELALPMDQQGLRLAGEYTASSGYGLSFVEEGDSRIARWSIRQANGTQHLYYTAQMLVAPNQAAAVLTPPPVDTEHIWSSPLDTAAEAILSRSYVRSADPYSLTTELLRELTGPTQGENARLLLSHHRLPELMVNLLNQAGVPARTVTGLMLEDGRRRQTLSTWLVVFKGDQWALFDLASGRQGRPDRFLLWNAGAAPVLQVEGGRQSQVHFAMLRQSQPATAGVVRPDEGSLLGLSIHSLPLEEQAIFRTILLIPIGALIVVFLRILVGIRTSGTFMPVLIALAFIQTTLITGLLGFLLVVATGLVIRNYLSHLNLLLVARVSAVIITVIAIISVFSVVSYRLGLNAGLTITFFPMIILSWTIERMSILWEEEGPREVMVQGAGSLLTAVLAYLAMTNPWIRHITFNFLGVQLMLMSLILLLGNYTGYRLLELRRFQPLIRR